MPAVIVLAWAAAANANTINHSSSVSFTTDLNPPETLDLPAFDTLGGTLTLTDVTVTVRHSGSVQPGADPCRLSQGRSCK